jgi:hypothetical protein
MTSSGEASLPANYASNAQSTLWSEPPRSIFQQVWSSCEHSVTCLREYLKRLSIIDVLKRVSTSHLLSPRPSNFNMASITTVDLLALATSLPYAAEITSFNSSTPNVTFQSFHNSFSSLLGSNASWTMVANESYQAFHEAGVYDQASKSLYISSNWAGSFANPINMSILNLQDYSISSVRYSGLASPNGGCTYVPPGSKSAPQLLFCDEGNFDIASGLTIVDPATKTTKVLSIHS